MIRRHLLAFAFLVLAIDCGDEYQAHETFRAHGSGALTPGAGVYGVPVDTPDAGQPAPCWQTNSCSWQPYDDWGKPDYKPDLY